MAPVRNVQGELKQGVTNRARNNRKGNGAGLAQMKKAKATPIDELSTSASSASEADSSSGDEQVVAQRVHPGAAKDAKVVGWLSWLLALLMCSRRSAPMAAPVTAKPSGACGAPARRAAPKPPTAGRSPAKAPKVAPLAPKVAAVVEEVSTTESEYESEPEEAKVLPPALPEPEVEVQPPVEEHTELPSSSLHPPPGFCFVPGLSAPPGLEAFAPRAAADTHLPADFELPPGLPLPPPPPPPAPGRLAAPPGVFGFAAPPPGLPAPWAPTPPVVLAPPPGLELASAPPAPYSRASFCRALTGILRELSLHRNTGRAVQQVREEQVPEASQRDEFVDILTRTVDMRNGSSRRVALAFAVGLAAGSPSAFSRAQCVEGLGIFFKDVAPGLKDEVPNLGIILRSELLPSLRAVFAKAELDACLPEAMNVM